MAVANFETREINCKVLYFGCAGAGKTENLRSIYRKTSPEVLAGLFDMGPVESSQTFEFLPISLGYVREYHLKLHLFTFCGFGLMPVAMESLLRGVDGVVFVVDSQKTKIVDNLSSRANMIATLESSGYNFYDMPRVTQINKMDLEEAAPLSVLKGELALPGSQVCTSVATESEGTLETLKVVSSQVLRQISQEPMRSVGG